MPGSGRPGVTGRSAPVPHRLDVEQLPVVDVLGGTPYFRIASVDYLRAMFVAHGALPPRDEPLARLERAVADLLAQVPAGEVIGRGRARLIIAPITFRPAGCCFRLAGGSC